MPTGGTYGPAVYAAYIPFVLAFPWTGCGTTSRPRTSRRRAFDIAAMLGLLVAGWRLANPRLGVLLAFGWAANPFTLYALNLNTNDALVGALLAWTMALLARPAARGALLALRRALKAVAALPAAADVLAAPPAGDARGPGRRHRHPRRHGLPARRVAADVLGRDARLPAGPGHAALDLDAAHLPPGLARPALAPAGRTGRRRARAACCWPCCRAAARTPPRSRRWRPPRCSPPRWWRATGSTRTSAGGCRWCCSGLLLPREGTGPEPLSRPLRAP